MLNQFADIDRVFDALADPTRREIVERLGNAPASITQLAEPLPMSLPAVLQHVQVLERCGLIATQKVGRVRTCRLEVEALDGVEKWVAARRRTWDRRLENLGRVVGQAAAEPANEPSSPREEVHD